MQEPERQPQAEARVLERAAQLGQRRPVLELELPVLVLPVLVLPVLVLPVLVLPV